MKFKAGVVQFNVRLGNVDANVESAVKGIDDLGVRGVKLAVLPEMWTCGFHHGRYPEHAERTPEILSTICLLAKKYNMLIAGSMPEICHGKIYNTLYLIESDGTILGSYRKIHLFTYGGEDRYFAAGDMAVCLDTSLGPVGLMICYDTRFPELGRTLVNRGAKVLIVSAQWPTPRVRNWDILIAARAMENQLYVIASNRCGKDLMHAYPGHSWIISPAGEELATAGDAEVNIEAEIDLTYVDQVRSSMRCLKERVFSAYDLDVAAE